MLDESTVSRSLYEGAVVSSGVRAARRTAGIVGAILIATACADAGSYIIVQPDLASGSATVEVEPTEFVLNEADTILFTVRQGGLPVASKLRWTIEPSWAARVTPEGLLIAENQADPVEVTVAVGQNTASAVGSIRAVPAVLEGASETLLAGFAGAKLPDSISVQVLSATGKAVSGVPVSFEITAGEGTLSHTNRITASGGGARVAWTLGPHVGMQSVRASAEGLGEVVFQADVMPDLESVAPEILEGEIQSAPAGSLLPDPLIVEVSDALGNTLPNVPMVWTFSGGGGYLTDNTPEPVDTLRVTTDGEGASADLGLFAGASPGGGPHGGASPGPGLFGGF